MTPYRSAIAHGAEIRIQNLNKSFGNHAVLRDINLEVAAGEFIAIVGRSGCGKSTLLRLLAGLETPGGGQINSDGELLTTDHAATRIMFQDARLLPWKTVLDNVALGLKRGGRHRAMWALQQVGLAGRAKDWPTVLSGGQRQRVALARALVHQPRLLLLDEPLGALDALTRIEMQRLIETLWQEQQFTTVLVTHDVEEAVALADRVILIEQGTATLDLKISLPRPRHTGSAVFADLKSQVLNCVLGKTAIANPIAS